MHNQGVLEANDLERALRSVGQHPARAQRLGLREPWTIAVSQKWVWLKIKQEGLRRFWSMFPLTRVPFWHRIFEPQPSGDKPRVISRNPEAY